MRADARSHRLAAVFGAFARALALCAPLAAGLATSASAACAQDDENVLVDDAHRSEATAQYARQRDGTAAPRASNRDMGVVDDRNLRVPKSTESAGKDVDLQHRLSEVRVADGPDGITVAIDTDRGERMLTPREFVTAVRDAQEIQRTRGFLYVLFNITRPWGFVWVGMGFLAQAMFTYRMVLQWWASEKHKRSIVPVGYWWGSLFGGMLLFAYFIWRKDIVGYIGQVTAIFIYARNLMLIYRGRRIEAEGARPIGPIESGGGS